MSYFSGGCLSFFSCPPALFSTLASASRTRPYVLRIKEISPYFENFIFARPSTDELLKSKWGTIQITRERNNFLKRVS
jgi:hypothetical protein